MSHESEKCMYCDRTRNSLNKTNWNRHKAACEIATTTNVSKKGKVKSDMYKCKDIKSFFSCKRPKREISITTPTGSTPVTEDNSKQYIFNIILYKCPCFYIKIFNFKHLT